MTLSGMDFFSYTHYDDIILFYKDRQKKQAELLQGLGLEGRESIVPFQVHGTDILEVQSNDIIQAGGHPYSMRKNPFLIKSSPIVYPQMLRVDCK
jgi:copper oxidase (laccase) domain-containing protein